MEKKTNRRKGISLVELLLTLGIVSIALLVIFNIFFTSNKAYNLSIGKGFAQGDGRTILEYVNKELKPAKNLYLDEDYVENNIDKYYSLSLDGDGKLVRTKYPEAESMGKGIGSNISSIKFYPVNDGDKPLRNVIRLSINTIEKGYNNNYSLDIYFENGNILDLSNYDSSDEEDGIDGVDRIYYTKYDD